MKRLFEELGLDPLASPEAITERLRERIELASEAERGRLREAWEELTLHPRRRVAQSVACFVELDPAPAPPPGRVAAPLSTLCFLPLDAVALPRLEAMLDADSGEARSSTHIDMEPWPRELFE
jgi:hypothetical protein